MTQEEKSLLLTDLCARLPYSTLCYCKWTKDAPNGTSGCVQEVSTYLLEELMIIGDQDYKCQICEIKPYLRPMSSITEEEKLQLIHYAIIGDGHIAGVDFVDWVERKNVPSYVDWINSHHFDYRGFIEKGLALEAPEGMYKMD